MEVLLMILHGTNDSQSPLRLLRCHRDTLLRDIWKMVMADSDFYERLVDFVSFQTAPSPALLLKPQILEL
jgi:hypothetical protein